MELAHAIQAFLNDVIARDLSPKTYQRYQSDLADLRHFLQAHSVTTLEQVTAELLRLYMTDLQTRSNKSRPDEKLSPFTIEGRYRSIKAFFRWCEWEEYLPANPMRRVRRNKLPAHMVPRLSETQVGILLDEVEKTMMPQRNLALILLMVDSGLRRGEVLGLKLDDVYLSERRVRVFGKGRKDRDVPLGDASARALSEWLALRPPCISDQVFLTDEGTPFQVAGVRMMFVRLQARLGLPRLYPHLLRHTFAEMYLKRVRDVKSLQQILGHSRASTTLDLYVEHNFDDLLRMHQLGSPVDAIKNGQPKSVAH
jgi:site-specific recombinase XerD